MDNESSPSSDIEYRPLRRKPVAETSHLLDSQHEQHTMESFQRLQTDQAMDSTAKLKPSPSLEDLLAATTPPKNTTPLSIYNPPTMRTLTSESYSENVFGVSHNCENVCLSSENGSFVEVSETSHLAQLPPKTFRHQVRRAEVKTLLSVVLIAFLIIMPLVSIKKVAYQATQAGGNLPFYDCT
jgi:hypothetical protein